MKIEAVIKKMKTIMIKIIGNESGNDFTLRFRKLPYLADNLPSVVTNLKALNPNLFIDYVMHIF
jgi:hypothetical protein